MTLLPDDHEVRQPPRAPAAAATPPAPPPVDPVELARCKALRLLHDLQGEDVLLVAAILDELPSTCLIARCEAETARGIEGTERVELPPTSRLVIARGALLSALNAFRLVLGLKARPYLGVDGHLRRARGGQP